MLKNIERIRLWFANLIKNLFQVDKTAQLVDIYEKQKSQLEEADSKYYRSKGLEQYYTDEIETITKLLSRLGSCAKKVKNDDAVLRDIYTQKVSLENKKKNFEEFLQAQTLVTKQWETLKDQLEMTTIKLKDKIDEIRMKEEFSKNMDKFSNTTSTIGDINIDEIMKEVQVDFNSSTMKLKDLKNTSIDDVIKDDGFEEYKNSLE